MDVEGYEAPALASASRLMRERCVLAAQIELTETGAFQAQSEGNIDMLVRLAELGYDLREVPNKILDSNMTMPPEGVRWAKARGVWQQLPRFVGGAYSKGGSSHQRIVKDTRQAYVRSLLTIGPHEGKTYLYGSRSTNIVGLLRRPECRRLLPRFLRGSDDEV